MIRFLALEILGLWRTARSAFGPPCCRFRPTCSEYARDAVTEFGLLRAAPGIFGRLMRCHPFHPGGFDPVGPRA